jgi:hypothetical protein
MKVKGDEHELPEVKYTSLNLERSSFSTHFISLGKVCMIHDRNLWLAKIQRANPSTPTFGTIVDQSHGPIHESNLRIAKKSLIVILIMRAESMR